MQKHLLVTLADENYIDQAKQLFSSAYFNAGWQGDYMLLAQNIREADLEWFSKRGILIYRCAPLREKYIGVLPPVTLGRFYLFTEEFKKWRIIIYLDADIIVRAQLDNLVNVKGFAAVRDPLCLAEQFNDKMDDGRSLYGELKKRYCLKGVSFNAGVMAFSTDIINKALFAKLIDLVRAYGNNCIFGDQGILNLFFYNRWKSLPLIYNLQWMHLSCLKIKKPEMAKAIILHFSGVNAIKPWFPESRYYLEWRDNFEKADLIRASNVPSPPRRWSKFEIELHSLLLSVRFLYSCTIDRYIGLVGIRIKKKSPSLYYKLKRLKNKICKNGNNT